MSPEIRTARISKKRAAAASAAILVFTAPLAGVMLEYKRRIREREIFDINSGEFGPIPPTPHLKPKSI